ncbi:hypothetical protein ACFL3V_07350 [Nanoarchaeota archaeon]
MEDDELLFEIKENLKRTRTTFESVINKKDLCHDDLDAMFNELN